MLTLIHGDDTVASRAALLLEKNKHTDTEVITLIGKGIDLAQVSLATETNSLFAIPKLVILENILKGPPSKEKTSILEHISSLNLLHDIIVWEDRKIEGAAYKKYFSKSNNLLFQLPAELFKFLDSIGPDKSKILVSTFHTLLQSSNAELIFVMMQRQFRYMIMAKDLHGQVPELAPWQAQKFLRQASFFTLESLIFLYRQLISIDYRIKTGQSPLSLSKLLDLFFLSL